MKNQNDQTVVLLKHYYSLGKDAAVQSLDMCDRKKMKIRKRLKQ